MFQSLDSKSHHLNQVAIPREYAVVNPQDADYIDFTGHSQFQPFVDVIPASSKPTSSLSSVVDQFAGTVSAVFMTLAALFTCGPLSAALALSDDEVELAELPPPYVPAIFGLGLLAGVGLLTSSLGNVMDEEASLGLQSGARAKKEMERGRSSFFKKR